MCINTGHWAMAALLATAIGADAAAQNATYPSALSIRDVLSMAVERRAEITAARARVRAAEARPAIVSALEDPMVSASIDHLPLMFDGADVSLAIEQRFPLSKIRSHRRASALADLDRFKAEMSKTQLAVRLDAAAAFLMLHERRETARVLTEQIAAARDVVTAANARYAAAIAPQSDVLLAEVEVARLMAASAALAGDLRAAEVMLNASLAMPVDTPVPPLLPISLGEAGLTSGESRPELDAARALVHRADADIHVMKSMFRPMATVRAGPSYTMAEGKGVMLMVGVSVPLQRKALKAGVAEAEAMREMASADLEAMTRMVAGEVAAARAEVDAARVRLAAMRGDVLPRARAGIAPAVSGYSAGQLPLTTVLAAVQALWQTEADLVSAEVQVGLALVKLHGALGRLEGAGR